MHSSCLYEQQAEQQPSVCNTSQPHLKLPPPRIPTGLAFAGRYPILQYPTFNTGRPERGTMSAAIEDEDTMKEGNGILFSIAKWRDEKAKMIEFAYGLAGGWEGWAQVEIAACLKKDHGYDYGGIHEHNVTTREGKIYELNDRQKVDILLLRANDARKGGAMFELKCESLYNSDNFVTEVKADKAKIEAGTKAAFRNATLWGIALAYSENANFSMANLGLKQYDPQDGLLGIWYYKGN